MKMNAWLYLVVAGLSAAPPVVAGLTPIAAGGVGVISYQVEPNPSDLANRFSASRIALLEELNRADRDHPKSLLVHQPLQVFSSAAHVCAVVCTWPLRRATRRSGCTIS
jgi:hypothetical protein